MESDSVMKCNTVNWIGKKEKKLSKKQEKKLTFFLLNVIHSLLGWVSEGFISSNHLKKR